MEQTLQSSLPASRTTGCRPKFPSAGMSIAAKHARRTIPNSSFRSTTRPKHVHPFVGTVFASPLQARHASRVLRTVLLYRAYAADSPTCAPEGNATPTDSRAKRCAASIIESTPQKTKSLQPIDLFHHVCFQVAVRGRLRAFTDNPLVVLGSCGGITTAWVVADIDAPIIIRLHPSYA